MRDALNDAFSPVPRHHHDHYHHHSHHHYPTSIPHLKWGKSISWLADWRSSWCVCVRAHVCMRAYLIRCEATEFSLSPQPVHLFLASCCTYSLSPLPIFLPFFLSTFPSLPCIITDARGSRHQETSRLIGACEYTGKNK